MERLRGENRRHFQFDWNPGRVRVGDGFGGKRAVVVADSGERARGEEGGIATTVAESFDRRRRREKKEEFYREKRTKWRDPLSFPLQLSCREFWKKLFIPLFNGE